MRNADNRAKRAAALVAHTDARIGTVIAGYRIEALLGRGGMSVVYLAEHLRLGRKAAFKVLAPELARDENFRERFIRESRIAASIDQPNIIPIYDAGEDDGLLYIAMRYVEGSDLGAQLKASGPLPLGQCIFVLEHLASALDAAHARGLVHRDVKPLNVLIERGSEHVYLTDFGVAKQTALKGLTQTGFFLGSVDYAAPEQIEGRPVDPRTDVYALGGVFYSCLTGLAPFEKSAELAVMNAHLVEPPPQVTRERPGLPVGLDAVVERAMSKAMETRFRSCGDLASAARAASLKPTTRPEVELPDSTSAPDLLPTALAAEQAQDTRLADGGAAGRKESEGQLPTEAPPEKASASHQRARVPVGPRARVLAIATIPALVTALVAGLGVYFVTRGDGTSSPAGGKTESVMTPKESLDQYLALWPAWTCHQTQEPPAGADASMDCATREGPQDLQVSVFMSKKSRDRDYDRLVRASPEAPNTGSCRSESWGGELAWQHGEGAVGGRVACWVSGGASNIVWTLNGDPAGLFVGRRNGVNHRPLLGWWVNARHVTFSGEQMQMQK